MTIGVMIAKKQSTKVRPSTRKPAKDMRLIPSRRATTPTINISAKPIASPGIKPPMNSLPTETSAVTP